MPRALRTCGGAPPSASALGLRVVFIRTRVLDLGGLERIKELRAAGDEAVGGLHCGPCGPMGTFSSAGRYFGVVTLTSAAMPFRFAGVDSPPQSQPRRKWRGPK